MKRTCVTLLLTLLTAAPGSAATIGLVPASQTAGPGDPVSVDLVVSDLGGEIVSAYDLDLLYDASVLTATNVSFGPLLGDAAAFEVLEDFDLSTAGVVDLAQLSLLSDVALLALQPDAFLLATIGFEAVAVGTTSLALVLDATNDVKGLAGQVLAVDVEPGAVSVVPEPQSALLFLLGAGVVASRLRRG